MHHHLLPSSHFGESLQSSAALSLFAAIYRHLQQPLLSICTLLEWHSLSSIYMYIIGIHYIHFLYIYYSNSPSTVTYNNHYYLLSKYILLESPIYFLYTNCWNSPSTVYYLPSHTPTTTLCTRHSLLSTNNNY